MLHSIGGPRALVLLTALVVGCASSGERQLRRDLQHVEGQLAPLPSLAEPESVEPRPGPGGGFEGSLEGYLAHAFAHSPALRASFEEWRAASMRPQQARRLPEPMLTFAGFVRAVETRVGPQRIKLGAMQWFPWPTKLTAGAEAAAREAEAAQRRFEAHALEVAAEVARAYWRLWAVQRVREVERDQVVILTSLSAQVRARVEVGGAELANLAQVDLAVSRARDRLAGLDEAERMAAAELVRAVGAPMDTPTPVSADVPPAFEPAQAPAALAAEAADHPRVLAMLSMSEASEERVREARADRFPRFGVGVDWIITADSAAAMRPPDSGKDAVIVTGSLSVPLWQPSYGAKEDESRARASVFRARALDARNRVMAEVQTYAARVRDDARRATLYQTTLVPQAQGAFESVVSSYVVGRSSTAELLLAVKDLLELQRGLFEVQAQLAVDVAELERAVGRPLQPREDQP